jgi:hypothetical protein
VNTDPIGADKQAHAELMAWMLSLQDEDAPDAGVIPPLRLARLAMAPAEATADERLTLVLAPSMRRALALARQALAAPAVNDNVFRVVSLAAADRTERALRLDLDGVARLVVEPGPAPDLPYLLSLTLRPDVLGGRREQRVVVRERRSGLVWLDGIADAAGQLDTVWPHLGLVPSDRLGADELELALPAGDGP